MPASASAQFLRLFQMVSLVIEDMQDVMLALGIDSNGITENDESGDSSCCQILEL